MITSRRTPSVATWRPWSSAFSEESIHVKNMCEGTASGVNVLIETPRCVQNPSRSAFITVFFVVSVQQSCSLPDIPKPQSAAITTSFGFACSFDLGKARVYSTSERCSSSYYSSCGCDYCCCCCSCCCCCCSRHGSDGRAVSWSFLTGLGPQPFFARGPYQALSPNIKGWSHFAPCAPFAERLNCRVPIPGPQPLSKT